MSSKSAVKEAMNVWGRNYLRNEGFDIPDDAEVEFEEETIFDGYCETCYTEWEVVSITAAGYTAQYSGSMYELVDEMSREVEDDDE